MNPKFLLNANQTVLDIGKFIHEIGNACPTYPLFSPINTSCYSDKLLAVLPANLSEQSIIFDRQLPSNFK